MIIPACLLVISVLSPLSSASELPLIEHRRVGSVSIGAAAQDVYEAFPAGRRSLVDLALEGMLSPALRLQFPGTERPDGVVAELAAGPKGLTVWRIHISDAALRTAKGIGVGSTVGQLRAAYRLDSVLSGEGNVVIRVEELSASFLLDQTGPGGSELWRAKSPAAMPDTVKIIGVLLT